MGATLKVHFSTIILYYIIGTAKYFRKNKNKKIIKSDKIFITIYDNIIIGMDTLYQIFPIKLSPVLKICNRAVYVVKHFVMPSSK